MTNRTSYEIGLLVVHPPKNYHGSRRRLEVPCYRTASGSERGKD
jgi:hypothetical protein